MNLSITRLIFFFICLVLTALSGCSSKKEQIRIATLADIEDAVKPRVLWEKHVGEFDDRIVSLVKPAIAYDMVYMSDDMGTVRAYDSKLGKQIWKTVVGKPVSGGVGVGAKKLFVGTFDGSVIALQAEDGKKIWEARVTSEVLSAPSIGNGVVVVYCGDGKIIGLDEDTGEQKWIQDRDVPSLTLRGTSTPQIASGGTIIGTPEGKVVVFLLSDGRLAWEQRVAVPKGRSEIERMVDVDSDPVIFGRNIYTVSYQGNIVAMDLQSGEIEWQHEMSSFRNIVVDASFIYATKSDDTVVALTREDGVIQWEYKALYGRQLTAPAYVNGYVVVADFEGYVHWLDASTGKLVGRVQLDEDGYYLAPITAKSVVYLKGKSGRLSAIASPTSG